MKVVVTGYMIRFPLAGMMLAFLHYVLGLHRLGHRVIYLEESGWPDSCYDPATGQYTGNPAVGIAALDRMTERFGLRLPVCYVDRQTGCTTGFSRANLKRHLASADLLLNIGGTCSLPEFEYCGRRILIDMDPMFTQAGRFAAEDLTEYHAYFSYGANIGTPECSIPDAGVHWLPTPPPVVTEIWARQSTLPQIERSRQPLTTICNWSAYGGIDYAGQHYGQKDEEFLRLIDVPQRSPEHLEIAVSGATDATKDRFRATGWILRDAEDVTVDMDAYARYIGQSRGEFSAAKHAYVKTNSGWFSDRSVCYLASGRPVVLQDTGIGRWLSASSAVLTFSTPEQAIECLENLATDYSLRCRNARELAEDCFGHAVVLPRLLDRAFSARPAFAGQT